MIMVVWLLWGIAYAVISALFHIQSEVRAIIINVWVNGFCYVYCFISTYWVIRQYHKQLRELSDDKMIFKELTLDEILMSKDGFDLFANHLVNEFSIEHLAFLYEMMQIKQEAIDNRCVLIVFDH